MKQPSDATIPEADSIERAPAHQRAAGEFIDPVRDRVADPEDHARTGLDGRAAWARALDAESARIARGGRWASAVVIEVSGPAPFVDWLASPDAAPGIPMLTETIHRHARQVDVVATLGPGRYGVLLVDTDQVRAINFVERVRSACNSWLARQAPDLRVVIGWADARPGRTVHEALADAEAALERDRQASWTS